MGNKAYIKDPQQIVNAMVGYLRYNLSVGVIGDYETIAYIFNKMIKNTNAEFVAGELDDGDGEPYYLDMDQDTIWVDKAIVKGEKDKYVAMGSDKIFIEDVYAADYFKTNKSDKVTVYSYGEQSKKPKDEVVNKKNDAPLDCYSISVNDDKKGFTFNGNYGNGKYKMEYRGSKVLDDDDIAKLLNIYVFDK